MTARTPEQITAQLRARLAEMEDEAKSPRCQMPCKACLWESYDFCKHPLIVGFEKKLSFAWDYQAHHARNSLCGEEKALWEPKKIPHWWDRNSDWGVFLSIFLTPIAVAILVGLIIGLVR